MPAKSTEFKVNIQFTNDRGILIEEADVTGTIEPGEAATWDYPGCGPGLEIDKIVITETGEEIDLNSISSNLFEEIEGKIWNALNDQEPH